eukprot:334121_1
MGASKDEEDDYGPWFYLQPEGVENKVLDWNTDDGVYINGYNGGNHQKWRVKGGMIREDVNNNVLAADNDGFVSIAAPNTNDPDQQFMAYAQGNGSFIFQQPSTKKYLAGNDEGSVWTEHVTHGQWPIWKMFN